MSGTSGASQLGAVIDRYDPAIAATARAAIAQLRKRLPGAIEVACDDGHALAVGFGPTEKASEAVFSITLHPRWVTLYFLQGARLADPTGRLTGSGSRQRHLVLQQATDLAGADVERLIAAALEAAGWKPDGRRKGRLVIRPATPKPRTRRSGAPAVK